MSASVRFKSLEEAMQRKGHCALAIGNFDGVHLGHQSLLRRTVELAGERNLTPAVLTFDPHPTTIVAPERVPQKLCTLDERLRLLEKAGAREILVLPFTLELAALSPEAFVRSILIDTLKVGLVLVGENFRFGSQQAGSSETLKGIGQQTGFDTCLLPPVLCRGEVVSSSAIRRYLNHNAIPHANRLLGRPFAIEGPVVAGFGIGSKQTVPTLNLRPVPGQLTPPGVFTTRTFEQGTNRTWESITNVGNRPTFQGQEVTIETFLLSPFEEPRPEHIRIEFHRYIRAERAFDDAGALRAQIMRDVGRAKAYWRRMTSLNERSPSIY